MAVDVDSYLDQALGLVLALLLPLLVGRRTQVTAHLQGDTGGIVLSLRCVFRVFLSAV